MMQQDRRSLKVTTGGQIWLTTGMNECEMRFRRGRIDEQVTRFSIETTASDGEFWLVNYLLILTSDWSTLTSDWSIIVSTHFWFVTSGVGIEVWRSWGSMRRSSWENSLRSCWTRLDCLTRRMKTVRLWLSPSAVCCIPSQGIVESNVSSPATKESKHPDRPMTLPSQPSCCVIRNSWERHTLLQ